MRLRFVAFLFVLVGLALIAVATAGLPALAVSGFLDQTGDTAHPWDQQVRDHTRGLMDQGAALEHLVDVGTIPPPDLMRTRLDVTLLMTLARLGATRNWHRIALDYGDATREAITFARGAGAHPRAKGREAAAAACRDRTLAGFRACGAA